MLPLFVHLSFSLSQCHSVTPRSPRQGPENQPNALKQHENQHFVPHWTKLGDNSQPVRPECSPSTLAAVALSLWMVRKMLFQHHSSRAADEPILGTAPVGTKALTQHPRQKHWEPPGLAGYSWAPGPALSCLWARNSGNCCSRAACGPCSLPRPGKPMLPCYITATGHHIPMHLTSSPPAEELSRMQPLLSLRAVIHLKPLCKTWIEQIQPRDCSYYLPLNPYSSDTQQIISHYVTK